jgi:uncharacterized protein (TIGR02217 family)
MSSFHDILFPLEIAISASGGPERRTEIVTLGSGYEERNARWANSRRSFDAGWGVKSFNNLATVVAFFEERRGRLYGFRFRDRMDNSSCLPSLTPSEIDQIIGTGDGVKTKFQLIKTYGATFNPYIREITKPVAGSVTIALDGVLTTAFSLDHLTGIVTFTTAPLATAIITAGFRFDVPVRFNADKLNVSLTSFSAGDIPNIPLIEIKG